ncbi:macro domain-containing protein [Paenisporosarcina indica]|uniref:macro domain-containing protein n=1 Tax=Paenisporosarcina indica TaxID=650093 RepID=UPI000A6AA340|nr:macro domain-containing protein [Paenisporosarcina indica]
MTIKIKFFDKRIIEQFLKIVGGVSAALSLILIFCELPDDWKIKSGVIFIIILCLIYFGIWIYANKLAETNISIGGTTVHIKKGDIFSQEGLKVIPFNEYFDTIVDDKIIAETSLNGKYIMNIFTDVNELSKRIKEDEVLNMSENILCENVPRKGGATKYKLGSSIVIDDYVLTAFSKFNDKNEAELTMTEYINFLLQFWNEINRVYAQKSVTVPVFGSGITRFKGGFNNIEIGELLNIMLWTFRISETRFKYPAKLTIVIYEDLFDQINLFSLQGDID